MEKKLTREEKVIFAACATSAVIGLAGIGVSLRMMSKINNIGQLAFFNNDIIGRNIWPALEQIAKNTGSDLAELGFASIVKG